MIRLRWVRPRWWGLMGVVLVQCGVWAGPGASNQVTHATSFAATNALGSFHLAPGFRIELIAAEPLVSSPVAMAVDENGRLFVVERPWTADSDESGAGKGRVRMLEDMDEHGQYKTSTVVADDLEAPSAVACYGGGLFVAAGHEILYLKDTTEDGAADVRRVVFSGFGGTNKLQAPNLLSSFHWGLSDRIYAASAGIGGDITCSNWNGQIIRLEQCDFSFNPRTLALIPESGPSQTGLSFDSFGRRFGCAVDHPLQAVIYETRYWRRNQLFVKAPEIVDVASPATAALVPASSAAGARTNGFTATWLSNAQGVAVYRGRAFPAGYAENAFVCDPDAHVVHRFIVREDGLGFSVVSTNSAADSELLVSGDGSFRPVQVINGPDGALLVADRQDAEGRGRIYRILPAAMKTPKSPHLGGAKAYDLVAALANPSGWNRDTAARLLFERQDRAALPLLGSMLSNSVSPVARLQAGYSLAGMTALQEDHLVRLLQDTNAAVRQNAVLLCELAMPNGAAPEALWSRMKQLADDPSILVRQQVAFTAAVARRPDKTLVLARVLSRDATNDWIQTAVFSSLGEDAGLMFRLLGRQANFRTDPAGVQVLERLAGMIGTKGKLDEVNLTMDTLGRGLFPPLAGFRVTRALGEGLHRTRSSLKLVDSAGFLAGIFSSAISTAVDVNVPEILRIEAVKTIAVSPYTYDETSDWLLVLASPQPLNGLRAAAIQTLCSYDDPRVLPSLLERWDTFPILLRRQAVMGLLGRASRVQGVLAAIQNGRIGKADLPSAAMNILRSIQEEGIAQRAEHLFGPVPVRRPEVMDHYRPALRLPGVADHGRELFNLRCVACHLPGNGSRLPGVDLAVARTHGKARLLESIVEPNAAVAPGGEASLLLTEEGELVVGIASAKNSESVTMQMPDGPGAVWPGVNVHWFRPQPWSLMPDGLEQGLSTQDMADLLGYLIR